MQLEANFKRSCHWYTAVAIEQSRGKLKQIGFRTGGIET